MDLAPVAAGQRQGVGQDAAITGEAQLIQRRGAVGAEGIGIEEHLGRLALLLAPQHVLVLQAVVLEEVVVAPLAKRRPLLGVVPGGGQLLLDGGAIRDLRQVTLSHPVLGLDPGLRLGAAIILQPAIGVGHGLAEIVIHLLTLAGDGVWRVFPDMASSLVGWPLHAQSSDRASRLTMARIEAAPCGLSERAG